MNVISVNDVLNVVTYTLGITDYRTGKQSTELWVIKPNGTGTTQIDSVEGDIEADSGKWKWSPDARILAYSWGYYGPDGEYIGKVRTVDISGQKKEFDLLGKDKFVIDMEWFNNQKIIVHAKKEEYGGDTTSSLSLLDASGEGNHLMISANIAPGGPRTVGVLSPDRKKYAFIEVNSSKFLLKIIDDQGNLLSIYESPGKLPFYTPNYYSYDLRWAGDSASIAFLEPPYQIANECICYSYLGVLDTATGIRKGLQRLEGRNYCSRCGELSYCPVDDYRYYSGTLQWLTDNGSLMGQDSNGMFVVNVESGERAYLRIQGSVGFKGISPLGKYITYDKSVEDT